MAHLGKSIAGSYLCLLLLVVALLSFVSGDSQDYYHDSSDENDAGADLDDSEYTKPAAKRAAVFLDKLIMAVRRGSYPHKQPPSLEWRQSTPAVDMQDAATNNSAAGSSNLQRNLLEVNTHEPNAKHVASYPRMGMVRRGQKNGRVFWRCYFNAVSCFRKK